MDDTTPPPLTLRQQKQINRAKLLQAAKRPLSEEQLKLLERAERGKQNRRGRKNPSVMPDRLARTSAFTPRRQGLITDSNFSRVYEVPGYSVVEVKGRELGSQHRDAIYALFRKRPTLITLQNPDYRPNTFIPQYRRLYESRTTWRELLRAMGRTEHLNNLLSLMHVLDEIRQVSFIIHQGKSLKDMDRIHQSRASNRLPTGSGEISSLIEGIQWEGGLLDSAVTVRYGTSVLEMIEKAALVSVNADVQFRLKSDHAKNFWPFIDSQPNFTFIDEERLAQLAGRELWAAHETSATRAQFRKECREAFRDMQMAGGLKSWREEVTGSGRTKSRRYHYIHALPRQMELALIAAQTEQPIDKSKEASHQTDSEFAGFMRKGLTSS
jgi:hypothetical protein